MKNWDLLWNTKTNSKAITNRKWRLFSKFFRTGLIFHKHWKNLLKFEWKLIIFQKIYLKSSTNIGIRLNLRKNRSPNTCSKVNKHIDANKTKSNANFVPKRELNLPSKVLKKVFPTQYQYIVGGYQNWSTFIHASL